MKLTTRASKRAARLRAITKERRENRRAMMMAADATSEPLQEGEFDIDEALKKLAAVTETMSMVVE